MTMHVQKTLPYPWRGGRQCSLQLLIQSWIYALGTWVPITAGWAEAVCDFPHYQKSLYQLTSDITVTVTMNNLLHSQTGVVGVVISSLA